MKNKGLLLFHVLMDKQTEERGIYYYDAEDSSIEELSEEFSEDFAIKEEIPYEEWNGNEIAEVIGDILEDCNMHSSLHLCDMFCDSIREAGMDDNTVTAILKKVAENIVDRYC